MPTITVRVTDTEKADRSPRRPRRLDVSAFVKRALELERDAPDFTARMNDHERRISRLEGMAGLD
jgi:hypothetical protein